MTFVLFDVSGIKEKIMTFVLFYVSGIKEKISVSLFYIQSYVSMSMKLKRKTINVHTILNWFSFISLMAYQSLWVI